MRFLLPLALLFICFLSSGQEKKTDFIKYRTEDIFFKKTTSKAWEPVGDSKTSTEGVLVVMDFKKKISIYSSKIQDLSIIKVLSTKETAAGGKMFIWECINQDNKQCRAIIEIANEGRTKSTVLMIVYSNYQLMYTIHLEKDS